MENNVIYSGQFKSWFGDWQNGADCSKVVDQNGAPLVVYHGSPSEFNEFKSEFMGQTGTAGGQGFYFTSDEDQARGFGNTKSFYLNIRKPLMLADNFAWDFDHVGKQLLDKGYITKSEYTDLAPTANRDEAAFCPFQRF